MKLTIPDLLNLIAAITVGLLSYFNQSSILLPDNLSKIFGLSIVYTGMVIVLWSAFYLKKSIMGGIEPETNKLVKSGPYKFIRHPVYLWMTIAIMGIPISLESWVGVLAVLIFFLPSEIYRAKLEEKVLSDMFKEEWENYKKETGFIIKLGKKHKS